MLPLWCCPPESHRLLLLLLLLGLLGLLGLLSVLPILLSRAVSRACWLGGALWLRPARWLLLGRSPLLLLWLLCGAT